jgi:transposase
MNMLTDRVDHVIGVDPDRDRVTAAIVDAATTGVIASREFTACPDGYRAALGWADQHTVADRRVWSIEGAGSYGAGLAVAAAGAGEWVVGFDRPQGRAAKDGAKSDELDAVRAARELLGREHVTEPRSRGVREGIRALLLCRNGAQQARTAAINELKALIVTCDPTLRETLRALATAALVKHCAKLDAVGDNVEVTATKAAMGHLARRITALGVEVRDIERELRPLIMGVSPRLLDEHGVGVVTAAQVIVSWSHVGRCRHEAAFARLAGVAPVEANSGQTQQRFRLSRGGDRALNRALHTIVITRCRQHPATCAYIARRISEGKTPREARRCLKRYVARHLYRLLENAPLNA